LNLIVQEADGLLSCLYYIMTNKIRAKILFRTEPDIDLIRGRYGANKFRLKCGIMLGCSDH